MKKNLFLACLMLAAVSMFSTSSARSQTAIFDRPIKEEPGKGWWDTDPDQYKAFVALESAKPDLVIDGSSEGSKTVSVKKGSVIEIHFSEFYQKEPWRMTKKSGPGVHIMLTDFHTTFEDGIAQIHKPGTRIVKFRVTEPGQVVTEFKLDAPDVQHVVTLTFDVQP